MIEFKNTFAVLDRYGQEIMDKYKDELASDGNDGGQLYKTMSFTVSMSNNSVFKITLKVADYWKYAEYGRGPGKFPPKEPIDRWIEYKRILPRPYTLSSGKTVTPTVQQLSFLIRRKIAREGTEGHRYFERSYDQFKEDMKKDLCTAIYDDLTEMTGLL